MKLICVSLTLPIQKSGTCGKELKHFSKCYLTSIFFHKIFSAISLDCTYQYCMNEINLRVIDITDSVTLHQNVLMLELYISTCSRF